MSILETRPLAARPWRWPDESACAACAEALARHAGSGADGLLRNAIIELHGPLGAGKTTFVRHLLHALGVGGRVKSPTYALMEPYELGAEGARWNVWHFDFYRFDDAQEWEDAGFRELFGSAGLKLVEWPEKAEGLLPLPDLRLHIEPGADEHRSVRIDALTRRGTGLIA